MVSKQTPLTEPEKRILEALRIEFFPVLNQLKDLLVRLQACRLYFQIYSPSLPRLEQEYFDLSPKLFTIDQKLTTPDILFVGLHGDSEIMGAYFKYLSVIKQNLAEAANYIEIIDRTLDRKRQTLQNNRTLLIAVTALFVSIVGLFGLK